MIEHVEAALLTRMAPVRLVSGRYATLWANVTLVDTARLQYFNYNTSQGRMLEPGDDDFAIVLSPHLGIEFVNVRARDPWDWSNRPRDEEGNFIPVVDIFNDEIQLTFDMRHGERPLPGEPRRRTQLHDIEIVGYQIEMGMNSFTSFMDEQSMESHQRAYLTALMRNASTEEQEHIRRQLDDLDRYDMMYVKVDHRDNVTEVINQLRDLGLDAWGNVEMLDEVDAMMTVIQLVMGGIGAVALLVAAINIANTMIMSIYERTKEIGIMKVIGCRLGDIGLLFLLEAMKLGLIGGIIGIAASFGISALLNNLPPDIISNIFGPGFWIDPELGVSLSVIPFWLVLLSLAISIGVAVIAGLYPSIRAMKLSALEAIRNE
jgi:cell division protein FtsX